ncbi:phosphatase PAP2 family protein [Pontibacter sp. KCTC 32443]|uniref:phosphatase PAP2 family protein n=1 Tax=Pontibacter TaxID=323449 RepID=UPI00164D7D27|nr:MULTISPECIES: phosphatase PAP2 family protein [Pontibacter]MBC5774154.1 phosphatase PAP2 family protein [Pontibacter sp. KCTC 32443]
MKPIISILIIFTIITGPATAQENNSPYRTKLSVDGPVIIAGMGLSAYGLSLMMDKDGFTEDEVLALDKNDVNKFDRFSAGYHSESAKKASDFPFYGSFAMPFAMMLNDNVRSKAGQVLVLYVETMAVTGTLFTLANGNTERARPLVYSDEVELGEKTESNAQNSFYAGHTAATAAATFFAAKIFHDFNPESNARPYVWAAAAAIPASVGYLRLKAGKHFLSDNILGYTLGAAAGIVIPQLHKKTNLTGISLTPSVIPTFNGAAAQGANLSYTF